MFNLSLSFNKSQPIYASNPHPYKEGVYFMTQSDVSCKGMDVCNKRIENSLYERIL